VSSSSKTAGVILSLGTNFCYIIARPLKGYVEYNNNKTRLTTKLNESDSFTSRFESDKSLPKDWDKNGWLPDKGVLYRQAVDNMQSIDSFLIVGNTIYLFQVTVDSSHSVKVDGLSDALKSIKLKNITVVADTQTRLVFITYSGTKLESIQPFKKSLM
jgi:hypothetical protein